MKVFRRERMRMNRIVKRVDSWIPEGSWSRRISTKERKMVDYLLFRGSCLILKVCLLD